MKTICTSRSLWGVISFSLNRRIQGLLEMSERLRWRGGQLHASSLVEIWWTRQGSWKEAEESRGPRRIERPLVPTKLKISRLTVRRQRDFIDRYRGFCITSRADWNRDENIEAIALFPPDPWNPRITSFCFRSSRLLPASWSRFPSETVALQKEYRLRSRYEDVQNKIALFSRTECDWLIEDKFF